MTARERLQRHFLIIGVLIFVAGLFLASDMLRDQTDMLIVRIEALIAEAPFLGMLLFLLLTMLSAMLAFFSSALLAPVAVYAWGKAGCLALLFQAALPSEVPGQTVTDVPGYTGDSEWEGRSGCSAQGRSASSSGPNCSTKARELRKGHGNCAKPNLQPFMFLRSLFYVLFGGMAMAAPFQIVAIDEIRVDARIDWGQVGTLPLTPVSDGTEFIASDANTTLTPFSFVDVTDMRIFNPGVGAVRLENTGPGYLNLYLNLGLPPSDLRPLIQGFGLVIEHQDSVSATYAFDVFTAAAEYIGTVSATSPGGAGGPVFLGIVDPEARIGIVAVRAAPGNRFRLREPILQFYRDEEPAAEELPVAGEVVLDVHPTDTYLHEGIDLDLMLPTDATATATVDNRNAHNLREYFPNPLGGDFLYLERIGISLNEDGSLNDSLGVFTSTEEILKGEALKRLPTALEAGRDYFTEPATGGAFETPTNIREDFLIGCKTIVTIPDSARYLMLSLGRPGPEASPLKVRVRYIPRQLLLDYIASLGLHGPNADLNSDLDGDGLTLLEEFVYGRDATMVDGVVDGPYSFRARAARGSSPGSIQMQFGGLLDSSVLYRAQFSDDLLLWEDAPDEAVVPVQVAPSGLRAVFEVVDSQGGPWRFGRFAFDYVSPFPN